MRNLAWIAAGLLAAALAAARFACERSPSIEPALGAPLEAPLEPAPSPAAGPDRVESWASSSGARDEAQEEASPAISSVVDGEIVLDGRVVDVRGAGIAGASVVCGDREALTDSDGRFELAGEIAADASLVAWKHGYRPIVRPEFGRALAAGEGEGEGEGEEARRLHFVLRTPALAIEGRVLGRDGRPAGGWRVEIADPTPLALRRTATVEGLSGYQPQTTGPDGRFQLDGLVARPYALRAFSPSERVVVGRDPVSGGERGVELSWARDRLLPLVEGRIVDHAGAPLANATVRVGDLGERGLARDAEQEVTAADGRFRFEWVPFDAFLYATAEGHVVGEIDLRGRLPQLLRGEPIELRLARGFELKLEPADPGRPGSHAVLYDGAGQRLRFGLRVGPSGLPPTLRLIAGSSPVVVVPEDAREIEVYFSGGERERRVLDLVHGETNVIRY